MKSHRLFVASLALLASSLTVPAQEATVPPTATPPAEPAAPAAPVPAPAAPAAQFTEEQLLETFGWFVGKRIGLSELKFTPEQVAVIMKGLQAAAAGTESPFKLEEVGPEMDRYLQGKQQQYVEELKRKGLEESAKFLTEIKSKEGVISLPSGVSYEIVQPGTGEYPKPEDTVRVHYTGRLVNGTIFDSSEQRNEPSEFPLNQVIPGWTEGIQKINKGGKIRLYIPPHLAYGDEGRPGIPPSSTLIFDVELIDIRPTAAPAPEAPAPTTEVPAPAPTPAPAP